MRVVIRTEVAVLIDDIDADLLDQSKWHVSTNNTHTYAQRRVGDKNEYLHRAIAHRMGDVAEGLKVDHINGDTLDNRRSNLRVVSHRDNIRNRKGPNKGSASGHLGVSPDKARGGWRAYIKLDNKMLWLGRFDNIDDAVSARINAEKKHWGDIRSVAF